MKNPSDQNSLQHLTDLVRAFADEREWGQFHTPRNLILALVGEVGELAAEFQWTDDSQISENLTDLDKRRAVGSELADVLSYLLRLADVTGFDLADELRTKLAINELRYPAEQSKGSSEKYTTYE